MKKVKLFGAIILMLLLGGCAFQSGDDLLRAPQPSKHYVALQTEYKAIMEATGAVPAAPESGNNRNSIQLIDLDNDGEDEAVSFFQDSKKVGQFTVYVHKRIGQKYIKTGQISGTGTAIESVDYPVFTPEGNRGIVIAWQIAGEGNLALTACAFEGLKVYSVLETEYTMFALYDMDGSGTSDLITFQADPQGGRKIARLYCYGDERMELVGETRLSPEVKSLVRVTTGYAAGNLPAVYVEEKNESGIGLMTDIFVYDEADGFRSIAVESGTGTPFSTFRALSAYAADINNDGIIEIPRAIPAAGTTEDTADAQYFLDWYAYGKGERKMVRSTYYSTTEEWMLTVPEEWHETVSVTKSIATSGMACTIFSEYRPNGEDIPLLRVYYITSDIRNVLAENEGMIPLNKTDSAIYTARIPEEAHNSSLYLSRKEIETRFSVITKRWGQ